MFLAIIMFLVGQDLRTILITQAIILSLEVLVLYWLARHILPPVMAFTGSLIAAFSPWGTVLVSLPLSDGLFLLLLILILFVIKFTQRADNPVAVVLAGAFVGLLTGAAVLVRPIWPIVILVAVALLFLYGPRRKGAWLLLIAMLVCASTPLSLWKGRNLREANFDGLSDVSGITVWRYLASRVSAQDKGLDRFTLKDAAMLDERKWEMTIQEADNERWRRAKAVFQDHPILTAYCFVLSALEHAIHPSPDVLRPAKLSFYGDFWVLAVIWGGLLTLAYLGWRYPPDPDWDDGIIDRSWLSVILVVCLLLTLSSGISFGAGSRLRAPLELIVPLLAAVGLLRVTRAFQRAPMNQFKSFLRKYSRISARSWRF
jgi:hypothetical protein